MMASFMANFFPGGSRDKSSEERPKTPGAGNDFVNPTSTPQGSPSKKTTIPGAHDLPEVFENALKLNPPHTLESPLKLGRPQSVITTPVSPTKPKPNPLEEASPNVDDSILHRSGISSGSPLKKQQGQENTPPSSRLGGTDSPSQHSHAALSRHELYQTRDRPTTPAKKFNTSRALTAEELEILQRPNVRRLTNVTQLCMRPLRRLLKINDR